MDKVLVLRLLIYGVITQVADKKHACGNTGTAASYRRPDGITIVCLPLPDTTGDGESKHTLLNHGITLRVAPGDNAASQGLDRTKAKRDHGDLRHDITSTTASPIEDSHSKNKHRDELKSHHKVPEKVEKDDEEEEEEEEEEPVEEKTHKRSVDSNSKEPKHVPNKQERSAVHYNDDAKSHDGTNEDQFEKVTIERHAKQDGAKKQTLTLANLRDMLGKDNDDEIEQYILIRRRKKPSHGGRESGNGVMLPLASTTMSTTDASTHHDTRKRRNTKSDKRKQTNSEHDSQSLTEDNANSNPTHKPTKRELNHYGKGGQDQDQYSYGGEPEKTGSTDDHNQSSEKKPKKKKKKRKTKKHVDSEKEEYGVKKKKKKKVKTLKDEYTDKPKENIDHKAKGKEVISPPAQIIIINVPVAHNGTISTTLAAPKPNLRYREDNFNHFLRVFKFTPQNTHNSNDEAKDEKQDNETKKKRKRKKRKFETDTKKKYDQNQREKSKHQNDKHKTTTGENGRQPHQPETIYTLLLSKQINEEGKQKPKDDSDDDKSGDKVDKDLKYFMQQIPKSEPPNMNQHSYRFGDRLTSPEDNSRDRVVHKPHNNDNNNSNYKKVKITQVTLEHGNKSDPGQAKHTTWPKKGKFHHEFNHSFEFKKKTESSHEDFEDFFNDNSAEEEEDGENKSTKNKKQQDEPKQKIIWKMMKQVQSMPWFKPETHSEPRR